MKVKKFTYFAITLLFSSSFACAGKEKLLELFGETMFAHVQKRFTHSAMRTQGFKPPRIDPMKELQDSKLPKRVQFLDRTYERFLAPSDPIPHEAPIIQQLDDHSILAELKKKD